jgi:RimJ/RimL family protein N-acetyltransferase
LVETARLLVEPLRVADAEEMAALLGDPDLHKFTGGEAETLEQLRSRYSRPVVGESADGEQGWLNWIVRDRESAVAVGTVQATVRCTRDGMSAELAWVIAARYQRQGYATEAASGVLAWLRERGVRVFVAHVHPEHAASIAVARHLGLEPTDVRIDGEARWARVLACEPAADRD